MPESGVSTEVVETTIQRLFGVGMTLAFCVDHWDPARLGEAVDEIDHTIRELRIAAFAELRPVAPPSAAVDGRPDGDAQSLTSTSWPRTS